MRWTGMPTAMWAVFAKSFEKQLTAVLGYDPDTARKITERPSRSTGRSSQSCPNLKKVIGSA